MAKSSQQKVGKSRIRFIMLDAEIPEGDLSQITMAIQNALKHPPVVQMRALSAPAVTVNLPEDEVDAANDLEQEAMEVDDITERGSSSGAPKQRKVHTPKVLELDLKSPCPLADFMAGKTLQSDVEKYLAVAAWFKEHRQLDAIGPDHIYTCYRAMSWSTAISDFGSTLRKLKSRQLMGKAGEGLYAINHLGLDRVANMSTRE